MQLQNIKDDVRVVELQERKGMAAGMAVGGAVGLIVSVIVFFAMANMGVFIGSTVRDAIPTDTLSTNATALLDTVEQKQTQTYNILLIIPIFSALISLIVMIVGLTRG